MKFCVSTGDGTWTNWSTFEPDPDYSPDTGTGLLSPISYSLQRGILLRRENPTYRYWAPVVAARRCFKMVLLNKKLNCRREIARCFVSLNSLLKLWSQVRHEHDNNTSQMQDVGTPLSEVLAFKLVPFESLGVVSYSPSIVNMALSCIIF